MIGHQGFRLRSMQSKFLATVVPMALCAIVVVFGAFEYLSMQRAEADLRERLDSLLAIQGSALSDPIWTINDEQVRLTVNALMSDPEIALVEVYDFHDSSGFVKLFEAEKPGVEPSFVGESEIFRDGTGREPAIGKLVVGVSDTRIAASAAQRLLLVASLAVALMICVVGSILISYRRIVATPLDLLLSGIRASKDNTQATAVNWSSTDEMGSVIAAFNEMSKQRAANERDLRLAKDELEKRVEDRTRELAVAIRQLREAIESISEGFSLFDKDDRLLLCNTRYKRLVKPWADQEELSRALSPGTPFLEILRGAVASGIINIPAGEEEAWIEEQVRTRRSSGRSVLLQISGEWIRVTERKTQDGSTVAVYSNITELELARLEAEAANEAKSTFLATMSHEIRTPMNGVLGMLEVLERSPLNQDQRNMTETITKSATVLLGIIDDILDFSKIEAGRIEIERTPTSLRQVCESAVILIAPTAEQKNLDLSLTIEPALPPSVYADPLRVRQVLINLLGNAVKFTTEGSIGLRVRRDAYGRHIRFEVTDSGVGVADDQLSQIFSPFGQAESDTTRKYGGTGLGLAISQRLVKKMGGSIGAESVAGQGSTFWFTLPSEPAPHGKDDLVDALDFSGHEALVATRSAPVYAMIEELLTERGARVQWADTPTGAVSAIQTASTENTPFDLVVIDQRLSPAEFTGLEALANRKAEDRAHPGLSVCSGSQLTGNGRHAVDFAYLDRPPTRYSLLRAAGIVLGMVSPDKDPIADPGGEDSQYEPSRPAPTVSGAIDAHQLILIVDDHKTNRDVIQRQLVEIGYASQVAGDGEEALAMWRETPYALILSDCHMPVLDGFGLTAAIRAAEAKTGSRTPIVALTANALVGEADLCLNAGMDDYLAKPVGLQRLRETLARWIGHPKQRRRVSRTATDPTAPSEDPVSEASPFDPTVLQEIYGHYDRDFLDEVVEALKPQLNAAIVELHQFLDSDRIADIAETAHKGAGAAGSVAATDLSDRFRQLEDAARKGRTKEIPALVARVQDEIARVLAWDGAIGD